MKAPPHINTPADYLAQLPADRKAALTTLHRTIRRAVPKLKPVIVYGMLGYGPFHYRYASGREGDTAIICLASQKNYISLYLCACTPEGYLAELNKHRLGKVSVGKSCIRFKTLDDLNLDVAIELVKQAADLAGKPGGFAM
ncbi:MAG: DUF1801 domain-containing protein [Opitutaceae bacterium]